MTQIITLKNGRSYVVEGNPKNKPSLGALYASVRRCRRMADQLADQLDAKSEKAGDPDMCYAYADAADLMIEVSDDLVDIVGKVGKARRYVSRR
jgi:glycyl-tRNA synthetase beta subunit